MNQQKFRKKYYRYYSIPGSGMGAMTKLPLDTQIPVDSLTLDTKKLVFSRAAKIYTATIYQGLKCKKKIPAANGARSSIKTHGPILVCLIFLYEWKAPMKEVLGSYYITSFDPYQCGDEGFKAKVHSCFCKKKKKNTKKTGIRKFWNIFQSQYILLTYRKLSINS
jgi:hypothetical protein